MAPEHEQKNQVNIQIVTGSGNYPESGYRHFNVHEKLEIVLHQAATHLKLQSTDGWVARLGDRNLDPTRTIGENQIPDPSKIFWAPTERGGGGSECTRK